MPTAKPDRCPAAVRLLFAAALTALGCGGRPAPPPIDPGDLPPSDTTAPEVLARLSAAYRDAEGYFDNALYRESFINQGDNRLIEPAGHQVSVAFERPNRFRLTRYVPLGGGADLEVIAASDGERLTASISDLPNQWLAAAAPQSPTADSITPDPTLRSALFPVPPENLFPQLDLLLATEERPPRLLEGAETRLLPNRPLDGAPCYRVALDRPNGEYVLWIDQQTLTLRRVDIPSDEARRQLDPRGKKLDWRFWIELRDATLGGTIDRSVFRPEQPEGARVVERFEAEKE